MIPGSIFSIISGFTNYSNENSKKLENFKDSEESKTKLDQVAKIFDDNDKCFIPLSPVVSIIFYIIIYMLSLLLIFVIFRITYIPWIVNNKVRIGTKKLIYKVLLIIGIFFPPINVFILMKDNNDYILSKKNLKDIKISNLEKEIIKKI